MSNNSNKRVKIFRKVILITGFFILLIFPLLATDQHQREDETWEEEITEEEYKAGEMILEHVLDSHEWHILSIGDFHLTIPLPVILYHNGKLHCFLSNKFEHGHNHYNSFAIIKEGGNKGQVVKILEERFIDEKIIVADDSQKLPLDFSITKNVLAIFISLIFMCWLFISIAKAYKKRGGQSPKGIQSVLEPVILFIRNDIAKPSIGEKNYEKFMPYLLTLFFFIFLNNLIGLIPFFPGGANVTGNIAVTGVLALFTFFVTNFGGNKQYWNHIVNTPSVPWWLKFPVPLMPVVELIGLITKPFVLMIRLFANIAAGHFIVLGFISLIFIFGQAHPALGYSISIVSVAFAIFMNLLEILVAFIQAYVFTLLSALYFGMATEENH